MERSRELENEELVARYARIFRRFLIHNVLHADDTPHRIALGMGLATLVAFLPIMLMQTVVAIGLAALFRANKAVCVPVVWITNPLTMWPIYGSCLILGQRINASPTSPDPEQALQQLAHASPGVPFYHLEFWSARFEALVNLGVDLWIGCAVVGIIMGIAAYFFGRWGIRYYRERHRKRVLRRSFLRSNFPAGKVATRRGEPS